jgi:hypothetical protein
VKNPVAVKLTFESKTVFGPALCMLMAVLVAVKLPIPVEDFEAFATETNDRNTTAQNRDFHVSHFLIHLLEVEYSCHSAPPRRSASSMVLGPREGRDRPGKWQTSRHLVGI